MFDFSYEPMAFVFVFWCSFMANLELQASAGFCCIDDVIHAGDYFVAFPLEAVMVAPADRFFTECRRRVWLPPRISATHCPGPSCHARLDALGLHT